MNYNLSGVLKDTDADQRVENKTINLHHSLLKKISRNKDKKDKATIDDVLDKRTLKVKHSNK